MARWRGLEAPAEHHGQAASHLSAVDDDRGMSCFRGVVKTKLPEALMFAGLAAALGPWAGA